MGNFYANRDEAIKAMDVWTEILIAQVDFVNKYGLNVMDTSKTHAGFVGSTTPLIDAVLVCEALQKMAYVLEDYFNSHGADNAQAVFEKVWESIQAIALRMGKPLYSMIPFMFFELIFGSKSDLDLVKSRCEEIIELIDKHEESIVKRESMENRGTIDLLHPLDSSKRTLGFYAYIKRFLVNTISQYLSDL